MILPHPSMRELKYPTHHSLFPLPTSNLIIFFNPLLLLQSRYQLSLPVWLIFQYNRLQTSNLTFGGRLVVADRIGGWHSDHVVILNIHE